MRKFTIFLYTSIIFCCILKLCLTYSANSSSLNNSSGNLSASLINHHIIFIDLDVNTLYLFFQKELINSYPIASGKLNTPSPVGFWKIIDKGDWGGGFGGSWMGLDVPWGTYGIHGTNTPHSIGDNASHGCFRMFNEHAKELYKIVKVGTPVIVSKGPYGAIGNNNRIILPGDRGSDVLTVQRVLKKFGFYKGNFDGFYGDQMKASLFKFQKSKGLQPHNEITKLDLEFMGIFPFE